MTKIDAYAVNADRSFCGQSLSNTVGQEPQLLRKDELQKHVTYRVAGMGAHRTTLELVWLPVNNDSTLKLAWNFRIVSPGGRNDWFIRIDA